MKKTISILLLVCTLTLCLVSCGHEHEFGDWYSVTEATCTKKGTEKRICKCGEYEIRDTELLNHSYSEWNIVQEATCSQSGSKERKCYCGATEKEIIPETNSHDYYSFGCKNCGKQKFTVVCPDTPITIETDDQTINITSLKVTGIAVTGGDISIKWMANRTYKTGDYKTYIMVKWVLKNSSNQIVDSGTIWTDAVKNGVTAMQISYMYFVPSLNENETYTLSFEAP